MISKSGWELKIEMIDMCVLFCFIENGDLVVGNTHEINKREENPMKFQWLVWVASDLGNLCANFCTD